MALITGEMLEEVERVSNRPRYALYVSEYPNDIIVVYWDFDYQQKRLLTERKFQTELDAWKYLFKNYKFTPEEVNFLDKYSGEIDSEMRSILYDKLKNERGVYNE